MKIIFVITRADTLGGAQVHVRDLAQFLVKAGHDVLVITGMRGIYSDLLSADSIQSYISNKLQRNISLSNDWQACRDLIRVIRSFQPDLVSVHSSKAGILGRLACQFTKTPCIFTVHGWAFTNGVPEPKRSFYRWIEKIAEPLANKIICVSEYDRQIACGCHMSGARLVTVQNGISDIPHSLRANPSQIQPLKVIMVARFDRQKDHQTLLKAFKDLTQAQLYLVGDGPDFKVARDFVAQNDMEGYVKFLGFQSNVSEFLAQSHIFVLSSHWEGFPYTIVEAMRAGLPVVASDVGGVSEAVTDGVNGYCVPRGDVGTLRDRLLRLIESCKLRQKMGQRSRQRYEAEFTFTHMFEKTLKVYDEVITGQNRHGGQAVLASPSVADS